MDKVDLIFDILYETLRLNGLCPFCLNNKTNHLNTNDLY